MTKEELASMFDHTFLMAYASRDDFIKLCDEAKDIGAAMVAINSEPVKLCKELLKGTNIHVGAAISFPLGQTTLDIKLAETKQAIDDGADEIDYVINIGKAKMHDWNYIEQEMRSIVELCHENQVICKVIFENCYLTKEEIVKIAEIAKNYIGSDDYKNASPRMREILVKTVNEDLSDYAKKITAPTLLIWGEMDEAAPLEEAKLLENLLQDGALIVLPGTHYAYLENINQVINIINNFMEG